MAIATGTALAIAGGAALAGAIGGAMDKKTSSRLNVGAASGLEDAASSGISSDYDTMRRYADAGPGAGDISAGTGASRDLAAMLDQYSKSGGIPGAADITSAQNLAGGLFQGQRMALQQNFMDQETESARNAAISGRGANDPVLRNKLAQEKTRQQMLLDANQGSLSQQLAMQMPGQKLGYASQRANVLQGLASQAMSNRQALLSIGEGIQSNERNFRIATATKENTQHGGVGGAISGGLAGLGAGMSAVSGMGGLPGMGGGGAAPGGGGGGFSLGAFEAAPAGGNIFGVGGGGMVNPFSGPGRSSFAIPQGSGGGGGGPMYLPRMN